MTRRNAHQVITTAFRWSGATLEFLLPADDDESKVIKFETGHSERLEEKARETFRSVFSVQPGQSAEHLVLSEAWIIAFPLTSDEQRRLANGTWTALNNITDDVGYYLRAGATMLPRR